MPKLARRTRLQVCGALAVGAVAIAGLGMASTASNTVPTSRAGDGSGAISGYTISNIHYVLGPLNPNFVNRITFTLNSAPPSGSTIKIRPVTTGNWYPCTNTGANVNCITLLPSRPTVLQANNFRVVVAQ